MEKRYKEIDGVRYQVIQNSILGSNVVPVGETLPEVTAADEGDVLTVNSSGEWEAAAPSGGSDIEISIDGLDNIDEHTTAPVYVYYNGQWNAISGVTVFDCFEGSIDGYHVFSMSMAPQPMRMYYNPAAVEVIEYEAHATLGGDEGFYITSSGSYSKYDIGNSSYLVFLTSATGKYYGTT